MARQYCDMCECASCDAAREKVAQDELLRRKCEEWRWNATTNEVARDMEDLEDDEGIEPSVVAQFMIDFGYPENQVGDVLIALDDRKMGV